MFRRKFWIQKFIFIGLIVRLSCFPLYAGHALISLPQNSEVTVSLRVVQRFEMLTSPHTETYFLIEEKASPMMAFWAFAREGTVPKNLLGVFCTMKIKIWERKDYREYEILEIKGPPPQKGTK